MAVKLAWLFEFFGGKPNLISRGENAYKSCRMENFLNIAATDVLIGGERSSLKDRTYSFEVSNAVDFTYLRPKSLMW